LSIGARKVNYHLRKFKDSIIEKLMTALPFDKKSKPIDRFSQYEFKTSPNLEVIIKIFEQPSL
jgi:hypothetical protein